MSIIEMDGKAKLGYGNMRIPMHEDGSIDYETTFAMVDKYMASGYNYFDTCYVYEGSEALLKEALVDRYPRESFQITTKVSTIICETEEEMKQQFHTSLERLGVDYIDTYFIHFVTDRVMEKIEGFHAFDWLRELKAKGLAKSIGFSFHGSAELLERLLSTEEGIDLVQLQINYLDWEDKKVQSRRMYEIARAHNVPISVMEPCKGGWIAAEESDAAKLLKEANPDASVASWAFRFVAGLPGIYMILSGMGNPEQVDDNINTIKNFVPLSEEERALTLKVVDMINAIPRVPCTKCKYCTKACPQKLNIPKLMETYNNLIVFNALESSRYVYDMMIPNPARRASACIGCGKCAEMCPQNIDIPKYLQVLVEKLES